MDIDTAYAIDSTDPRFDEARLFMIRVCGSVYTFRDGVTGVEKIIPPHELTTCPTCGHVYQKGQHPGHG